jgi:transcriptional regulator with XRE-family HTH domain
MFKKLIKYLLDNGGYTESSLASELKCSQSTVSRIKAGQEPRYSDGVAILKLHDRAVVKSGR